MKKRESERGETGRSKQERRNTGEREKKGKQEEGAKIEREK